MSAYQCDNQHLSQLAALLTVPWGSRNREPLVRLDYMARQDRTAYQEVFHRLYLANARSVAVRYRSSADADASPPAPPCPDPSVWKRSMPTEEFVARVIKAVACYRYQSREPERWDQTTEAQWCQALESAALRCLPTYDEAEWGAPFPAVNP